jgi:two-component system, NtrC family, sensor histidine kinase PilS
MSLDVRTEQRLRRIERLMTARLALLLAILGAALALARVDRSFSDGAEIGLYGTIIFAFSSSVAFAATFPRFGQASRFGAALVATDLITISALVHFTGGSESVFAPLFVLVVVCAAVLFGRAGGYVAAALAATSFGLVLVAERIGVLRIHGGAAPPVWPVEVAHWAVHAGAQVVVGLLASGLSRELDRTGQDLERSRSDLRRLRSLHERTVGSLLSGLLTTDTTGLITSFNPEAEHITAISKEVAVGRPIDEVLPGARERVMQRAEVGRTGRTRAQILYKNHVGATLHLGLSGSILREADGSAMGHVVIFQDVTQIVEMEGELRRSERQAAIGRLSAAIAHEIRNPLAAISGSIQMLRSASQAAGDEDSRRLMEIVLRETERLDGLITDFLQYARPAPPKLVSVLLAPLVHDLVQMFTKSRSPGNPIEVRVDVQEGLAVTGDSSQLRQLLWNLYLNAAQAMPTGGRLLIAAHPAPPLPQGRAPAGRNAAEGEVAHFLELVVADTGVGIAPEVIDRIFDPFFTTRREGSGLGLATVHRIVESHGGSLRVESTVGTGTTFRIRLPQAEEPQ